MVFFVEGVLKICSKFTGEDPCQNVISTKLLCNFIELTLRHGCFAVNMLLIFRTPFYKNTYGGLLWNFIFYFGNVFQLLFSLSISKQFQLTKTIIHRSTRQCLFQNSKTTTYPVILRCFLFFFSAHINYKTIKLNQIKFVAVIKTASTVILLLLYSFYFLFETIINQIFM